MHLRHFAALALLALIASSYSACFEAPLAAKEKTERAGSGAEAGDAERISNAPDDSRTNLSTPCFSGTWFLWDRRMDFGHQCARTAQSLNNLIPEPAHCD